MKNILLGVFVFLLMAPTAYSGQAGQGNGKGTRGSGQGQGQRMARMQESLGLSQEQMDQIRSIRENGGSREDFRAVLNDEQRVKLDEHRAARQGQGGGKGYRGGPENQPDRGNTGQPADVPDEPGDG